ncbi:MAG: Type 1 glutamine amidotransferase-like domain-containing protein, partial [Eubacterium sp.]|nr:Type 1 glutamine amidotransferase-like domain-containing protein [Eubacterium sp.]
MGKIVAISGGDLKSTESLNRYAIEMAAMKNPNILFIGTASGDDRGYIENFHRAYEAFGCQVKELCLVKKAYPESEIQKLLDWADIIYVGGGDTAFMMEKWKEAGLDQKLMEIYRQDKAVLTGISAGAICWFMCGHSDSESFEEKSDWKFIWADDMLGIYKAAFCPHYNEEGRDSFDRMLYEKQMVGLALDNNVA